MHIHFTQMLVNQLEHYLSQLINEQKMFPHTHDTFCCALACRMVFSMKKCFSIEFRNKIQSVNKCYTLHKIVVHGVTI